MKRSFLTLFLIASLAFSQVNSSVSQIYNETPAGTLNGVNTTFTLQNSPSSTSSVIVYRNGVRQKNGLDYSISGNIITFASSFPPISGDTLLVDYAAPSTNPLMLNSAGMNLNGQTVSGTGTFSGPITFASPTYFGSQPVNFRSAQASWDEFNVSTSWNQTGNPQSDWLGFWYNARKGSTDNWSLGAYLGVNAGWIFIAPLQIFGGATLQSGLNLNGQTLSGNATFPGVITQKSLNTAVRYVSTPTDTIVVGDHTLVLSGVGTETLPSSPTSGQELYLVNAGSTSITISAGGKNIWQTGTTGTSITIAANSTTILQWDSVSPTNVWRAIK